MDKRYQGLACMQVNRAGEKNKDQEALKIPQIWGTTKVEHHKGQNICLFTNLLAKKPDQTLSRPLLWAGWRVGQGHETMVLSKDQSRTIGGYTIHSLSAEKSVSSTWGLVLWICHLILLKLRAQCKGTKKLLKTHYHSLGVSKENNSNWSLRSGSF